MRLVESQLEGKVQSITQTIPDRLKANYKKLPVKTKLAAMGIAAVIVGGLIFWGINSYNANLLANTPLNNPIAEEYRKKLPELKQAAESKPNDVGAQREYAIALYVTKHLEQAREQYLKAITLSKNNGELYNSLGNVYRDLKNNDSAIQAYKKSIELNPDQLNAYANLANLQIYTLNDANGGIATYKHAQEAMPDNLQIGVLLGLAYEKSGDRNSAISSYRAVLDADPGNVPAKSNLERLGAL